jgi:hypothetical protein
MISLPKCALAVVAEDAVARGPSTKAISTATEVAALNQSKVSGGIVEALNGLDGVPSIISFR